MNCSSSQSAVRFRCSSCSSRARDRTSASAEGNRILHANVVSSWSAVSPAVAVSPTGIDVDGEVTAVGRLIPQYLGESDENQERAPQGWIPASIPTNPYSRAAVPTGRLCPNLRYVNGNLPPKDPRETPEALSPSPLIHRLAPCRRCPLPPPRGPPRCQPGQIDAAAGQRPLRPEGRRRRWPH